MPTAATMPTPDPLEALVAGIGATAKYRDLAPEVVRRVAARELAAHRSAKAAAQATRAKLHQIGGAYFRERTRYAAWLEQLRAANGDPAAQRAACRAIMAAHASAYERLPVLETLFITALAEIGPVASVLDVACGLNPLAIPWMPLSPEARYVAYDMYADMMAFLAEAMPLLGVRGAAHTVDVVALPFDEPADLALVLKTLPCLEQVEKGFAPRLLEALPARHLLVSYPARSLGGRAKGMVETYRAQFAALVAERPWRVQSWLFQGELAFLVDKQGG
jgi:16S rRNA (guanine(1405)-N(7))-methyltransferase